MSACTELTEQVHNLISYNVNSLKWTGDCFYGMQTFIETLASQVSPISFTYNQYTSSALPRSVWLVSHSWLRGSCTGILANCFSTEYAVSMNMMSHESSACEQQCPAHQLAHSSHSLVALCLLPLHIVLFLMSTMVSREIVHICTLYSLCHVQTWQVAVAQSAQE